MSVHAAEVHMLLAIIESPYAGAIRRNKAYLQDCIRHALSYGFTPYASHQMLTEALEDSDPTQRELGIQAGYHWWRTADIILFYTDLGWSSGMRAARQRAETERMPYRNCSIRSPMPKATIHAQLRHTKA